MERVNAWVAATKAYFREVSGELAKVSWPSWELLAKHTGIVVGMVALVAVFLFLLDMPLGWGLTKFLGR
ncbi:MAG TPA: preprotein translocase subunit SecE [Symbiobacteriaceae bacterium]|jgi:preprotein translocase subunit SecE